MTHPFVTNALVKVRLHDDTASQSYVGKLLMHDEVGIAIDLTHEIVDGDKFGMGGVRFFPWTSVKFVDPLK